jgi:GNAT superfamily N-acetyltransferase
MSAYEGRFAQTPASNGVAIRRATANDAEVLTRLRLDMQTELGNAHATQWAEVNQSYFERKMASEDFVAFVAEDGREIVATSGIVVYEAPPTGGNPTGIEGYIMNMYTAPEYRGKGLAGALLDRLVEYVRARGGRRLWLRTSEMGRGVYARAGFRENEDYMQLRLETPE